MMKSPVDTTDNSVHPAQEHHAALHEMHGHAPKDSKDYWLSNAEATSTLLIAAWYVLGVFVTLGILPDSPVRLWAANWAIPCLLGIFYFGSGYLFQRFQKVTTFQEWRHYMSREVIVLLTPFFAFTILTLLTANVVALQPGVASVGLTAAVPTFSGESLMSAVFVHPVGPVGYFIVLLCLFMVARTPQTKRGMACMMACALAAKVFAIVVMDTGSSQSVYYYVLLIADNAIWFVGGIALRFFRGEELLAHRTCTGALVVTFAVLASGLCACGIHEAAALALLTALGILCLYSLSATCFLRREQNKFFGFLTRYTMAIWLMHQILSALVFCGLFALGFAPNGTYAFCWVPVCAVATLVACYVLPLAVMHVLSSMGKAGFIVYPGRYLPPAS